MVLEPDNTQIYGFKYSHGAGGLTEIASKIGIETSNALFIQTQCSEDYYALSYSKMI